MRTVFVLFVSLLVAACGPDATPPGAPPTATPPAPPSTAPSALAERLPTQVDGRQRQSLEQTTESALGAEVVRVSAGYGSPAAVTLEITDFGTAEMTEMMGHGWALAPDADRLGGHPVQRDTAAATVRLLADGRYLAQATAPTTAEAEAAVQTIALTNLP